MKKYLLVLFCRWLFFLHSESKRSMCLKNTQRVLSVRRSLVLLTALFKTCSPISKFSQLPPYKPRANKPAPHSMHWQLPTVYIVRVPVSLSAYWNANFRNKSNTLAQVWMCLTYMVFSRCLCFSSASSSASIVVSSGAVWKLSSTLGFFWKQTGYILHSLSITCKILRVLLKEVNLIHVEG